MNHPNIAIIYGLERADSVNWMSTDRQSQSRAMATIAFVAVHGGVRRIFVRDIDKLEATALPGTDGGFSPFFSPDSQWVGFFGNQKLKKVLRSGGSAVAIADFTDIATTRTLAASWEVPDTIFFNPDVTKGI